MKRIPSHRNPAASGSHNEETSWQNVSEWYSKAVGIEGHYYHQHIILPLSLRLLDLHDGDSLLDLACGQGVLARHIPANIHYEGIDSAPDLIEQAKRLDKNKKHSYHTGDVSRKLAIQKTDFTHASIILALQNISDPLGVIRNARNHLSPQGTLLIVLNHPSFRIPRQTSWGIDEQNKSQYRKVNLYLTPLKIPIAAHPGKGTQSQVTWSYHFPLSHYSRLLSENGFVIEKLEEWASDKQSTGSAAKMENRARNEFPLFLAILARNSVAISE